MEQILQLAEHIAFDKNCIFVGTEHVLSALLRTENIIIPWLRAKTKVDVAILAKIADEVIETTASSGSAGFYSPSREVFADRSIFMVGSRVS